MIFEEAVRSVGAIAEAYRPGLRALRARDRRHIRSDEPDRISGSVDLDSALKKQYPNDRRWDYGVGWRPANGRDEMVYWIEIHPANSAEIDVVLAKLVWLKDWLRREAGHLDRMKAAFVWVSSGKTTLTPNAPQRKKMTLAGLQQKGRHFCIPSQVEGLA